MRSIYFETVRVVLKKVGNELAAIWWFPDNTNTWVTIGEDEFGYWISQTLEWEERTRTSTSNNSSVQRTSGQEFIEKIGCDIFNSLFSADVMHNWRSSIPIGDNRSVRVVFETHMDNAGEMASVPIEAMKTPYPVSLVQPGVQDSLVLAENLSVVRSIQEGRLFGVPSLDVDLPLRLLVFGSNPSTLPIRNQLDVKGELRGIREALEQMGDGIQMEIVESTDATFGRLDALTSDFQVFHFIGHGRVEGGVGQMLFDDGGGGLAWRDISDVTQLLLGTNIRLVVLNGCRTAAIPIFACQFPAVVGMQFRITDDAAKGFARGMYRELADSGQLDRAVWSGRREIWKSQKENVRNEFSTPVLYMRSDEGIVMRIRPRILSKSLERGHKHKPYEAEIEAKGGRRPYKWEITGLPKGLTQQVTGRNTSVAVIGGKPTVSGPFTVTVKVTSYDGLVGEKKLGLDIDAVPPRREYVPIKVGDFIDHALTELGENPPYQCQADELPNGLKCRSWGAVCGVVSVDANGVKTEVTVDDAVGNRRLKGVDFLGKFLNYELGDKFTQDQAGTFLEGEALQTSSPFRFVHGSNFLLGYHSQSSRDAELQSVHHNFDFPGVDQVLEQWPGKEMHLNGFLIQKCEVTNAEYEAFVQATGHPPPGHWQGRVAPDALQEHPVVNVSFVDAVAYCEWKTQLAQKAGLDGIYSLPTHWEWEKSAKGGVRPDFLSSAEHGPGRLYPWGDKWGQGMLHHLGSRRLRTVPVCQYDLAQSPEFVCDWGNVSEWLDGGQVDHGEVLKHIRGASFRKRGEVFALTFYAVENLAEPRFSADDIGFRCVIRLFPDRVPQQALVPLGEDQFIDSQGQRQFMGRFWMARFAVTNEEFSRFSGDHKFKQSDKWRPVSDVSYHEAQAFCQWKSQKEGRIYQLPTRQAWERAYRGLRGRQYPWGSKYCRYFCNSLESGWGRAVDVWMLPEGTTTEGIYNLCGNTFEWLVDGNAVGGSWRSTCEGFGTPPYPAASNSSDGSPRDDIGFRYVVYQ